MLHSDIEHIERPDSSFVALLWSCLMWPNGNADLRAASLRPCMSLSKWHRQATHVFVLKCWSLKREIVIEVWRRGSETIAPHRSLLRDIMEGMRSRLDSPPEPAGGCWGLKYREQYSTERQRHYQAQWVICNIQPVFQLKHSRNEHEAEKTKGTSNWTWTFQLDWRLTAVEIWLLPETNLVCK